MSSHQPGSTLNRIYIGNRWCIREVVSRFAQQTVFFVHDLSQEADEFLGPFYSMQLAHKHINAAR